MSLSVTSAYSAIRDTNAWAASTRLASGSVAASVPEPTSEPDSSMTSRMSPDLDPAIHPAKSPKAAFSSCSWATAPVAPAVSASAAIPAAPMIRRAARPAFR